VRWEPGRGKDRLKFQALFVDESQTSLPPRTWGCEYQTRLSEASRAWRRSGGSGSSRRREAEEVRAEAEERLPFFLSPLHGLCGRGVCRELAFFVLSFCLPFGISSVHTLYVHLCDRPGRDISAVNLYSVSP